MQTAASIKEKLTKILLIDDSEVIIHRLTLALYDSLPLIEVTNVLNGADALIMIYHAMPDIVVLDLQLPDMSGIHILKIMKQNTNCPKVIVLTNNSSGYNHNECMLAGADGFFDKSTGFEEAIQHITRIR